MKLPWLVSNPAVNFGRVCVRGTGIAASVIHDRWAAGETIEGIADDYDVSLVAVVAAVAFHAGRSRGKAAREALRP